MRIIWGTTGGNTEIVCKKVASVLEKKGIQVRLTRAEVAEKAHLTDSDITILASPTYGCGELEPHMAPFIRNMKEVHLNGQRFGVIALGDMRYHPDFHIESLRLLNEFIQKGGGTLAVKPLAITRAPFSQLQSRVTPWAHTLAAA